MNTASKTNRLLNESSPYLLQHAENPVDWYPWGDEAFEKAREEDKPIFLSIGYSCCHWCHVMAHESFESQEVADILNVGFISVKVDREERPDIDEVYMNVCQAMTGSGGWPLTIIMTPEKKPFFAGTYFPKNTAYGRMGLMELLAQIMVLWNEDRETLTKNSNKILNYFSRPNKQSQGKTVDNHKILKDGYKHIKDSFDKSYGGFSYSPKFPTPHYMLYLLNYWKAFRSNQALEMVEKTLEHMYRGGIFDHVGYGFSRYSTDHKWLVPHFEKMLYDNAMLLRVYAECFAATGNSKYRGIAEKICTYILRDMQASYGGFYSAEDADSEGIEGKYYVWDYRELKSELSEDELLLLESRYGVTQNGNFEGKNILNLINAHREGGTLETSVIQKLYDLRQKRIPPFKDTKISASWNGLMIEGLVRAGTVFDQPAYILAASKAADFVLAELMDEDATLSSIYKDGKRASNGFLSDYANMAGALISLYSVTLDINYLQKAVLIAEKMIRLFLDEADNRFYMVKKGDDELFMRPRDDYDGAMPSGNASAMMCLVRLAQLTGNDTFQEVLNNAINAFAHEAEATPGAYVHFLSSLLIGTVSHRQVVIAADTENQDALNTYRTIISKFNPFTSVIYYDKSSNMDSLFPELVQYKTTKLFAGYVCENFTCKQPVYSSQELLRELEM